MAVCKCTHLYSVMHLYIFTPFYTLWYIYTYIYTYIVISTYLFVSALLSSCFCFLYVCVSLCRQLPTSVDRKVQMAAMDNAGKDKCINVMTLNIDFAHVVQIISIVHCLFTTTVLCSSLEFFFFFLFSSWKLTNFCRSFVLRHLWEVVLCALSY